MELRHLRYFVAVAEGEHFGRAAAALRVSQPALSQQVADLERELGVALFARRPRGVRLTDAGRDFLGTARAALALVDAGAARARAIGAGVAGRVAVGLPEGARGTALARAALDAFRAAHPAVEVVVSGVPWLEQPRAVLAGRLDMGFAWSAGPGDGARSTAAAAPVPASTAEPAHLAGLAWARLFDDPGGFVLLPEAHPLAGHVAVPPAALRQAPFGLFARALHPPLHDAITAALTAAGALGPAGAVPAEGIGGSSGTGPLLAATGGWTLVPASQAADPPRGTVARPVAGLVFPAGLDAVWRADDAGTLTEALVAAVARAASPALPGSRPD